MKSEDEQRSLIETEGHSKKALGKTQLFDNEIVDRIKNGNDELLSPKQVAEMLGVNRHFVYELCYRQEIRSFPVGRLRKILRSDLNAWLLQSQDRR